MVKSSRGICFIWDSWFGVSLSIVDIGLVAVEARVEFSGGKGVLSNDVFFTTNTKSRTRWGDGSRMVVFSRRPRNSGLWVASRGTKKASTTEG